MTSYPYVYAGEQIEDCIERIKDYSEDSIPVLDNNNRLRGVLSFGAIGLYLAACKGQTWTLVWGISFCTGAAQLVAMLLSSVTGTVIPILFKKLGIDPAVASGPLITTVNDLVAVTAYYGLAWGLLIGVMGL